MFKRICFILAILVTTCLGVVNDTVTVKTSGGDYTSLSAAVTAKITDRDLVSGDSAVIIKIDGTWNSAEANEIAISATTDSTRNITIYTTATARHNGKYKATAYRLVYDNGYSELINIAAKYVTIDGLQISQGNTTGTAIKSFVDGTSNITIKNCLLYSSGGGIIIKSNSSSRSTRIYTNIMYNLSSYAIIVFDGTWNGFVSNNTIASCGNSTNQAVNLELYSLGDLVVRNNLLQGTYEWSVGIFGGTSSNNISRGASSPDTTFRSKTIVFIDSAGGDFHLDSADTGATGKGYDMSSFFTTDINGTTITSWPIGADQGNAVASCPKPSLTRFATAICTVGVAFSKDNSVSNADSVTFATLPDGLTGTKTGANIGRISGTLTAVFNKTGYLITAYGCNGDSTVTVYDTLTGIDTTTVSSNIYYVDFTAGSDVANGVTTGTAWKHCPGDHNATGTASSTTLTAGDTVLFKGGVVYHGVIHLDWSGSDGNIITYKSNSSWGTGRGIIDGDDSLHWSLWTESSRSYVTIDSLELRNVAPMLESEGFWEVNSIRLAGPANSYITIKNCYIHNVGYWETDYSDIHVDGWEAKRLQGAGIAITPAANCFIYNNEITKTGKGGISLIDAVHCKVQDNYLHDYINWAIDIASSSIACHEDTVIGNRIANLFWYDLPWYTGPGDSASAHVDYLFIRAASGPRPYNILVENNKFYNDTTFNEFGTTAFIFLSYADTITIRNNIFINPHSYKCIDANWTSSFVKIYNNTFYCNRTGTGSILFNTSKNGNEVIGNIAIGTGTFLDIGDQGMVDSLHECDYNLFINNAAVVNRTDPYNNYTFTQWKALGFDTHSIAVDNIVAVKFVSITGFPNQSSTMDLRLDESSPAIGVGTTISSFTNDYNDSTRTEPWDIGAYMYLQLVSDSLKLTSYYKQSDTIRVHWLGVNSTTDSVIFNNHIYVRDSVVYASNSKIYSRSGAKIYSTPDYPLTVKLNNNRGTPQVIKRKSSIYWK